MEPGKFWIYIYIYNVGNFSKEQKSKQEIYGSILARIILEGTGNVLERVQRVLKPQIFSRSPFAPAEF